MRDKLDLYQIPKKGIQKMTDIIRQLQARVEVHASQNCIAIHSGNENKSPIDEINDESDKQYNEKISEVPLPISEDQAVRQVDQEAFEATLRLCKILEKWAIKQRDFSEITML